MRKFAAAGFLMLSLAGVLLLMLARVEEARQAGPVGISYVPVAAELTLHEPVMVNVAVHNGLSRVIKIDFGDNFKGNFRVSVKLPGGKTIKVPKLNIGGAAGGISLIGILSVRPGETFKQVLLLNEWFDFNIPGRYEVEITLVNLGQLNVTGNKMTLEIRPRDANKLAEACASLTENVVGATSYREAADATRTLSYVQDPVAVPYLDRALWFWTLSRADRNRRPRANRKQRSRSKIDLCPEHAQR